MTSTLLSLLSVTAVALGIAGAVTIIIGVRRLLRAAASTRWASAPGAVVSSELVQRESRGGDGPAGVRFSARVRYRYQVGERTYESERVALDEVPRRADTAPRGTVERYAPGSQVTVRYDPRAPEQAVLEPGLTGLSGLIPAVGVILLGLAVSLFAIARIAAS